MCTEKAQLMCMTSYSIITDYSVHGPSVTSQSRHYTLKQTCFPHLCSYTMLYNNSYQDDITAFSSVSHSHSPMTFCDLYWLFSHPTYLVIANILPLPVTTLTWYSIDTRYWNYLHSNTNLIMKLIYNEVAIY